MKIELTASDVRRFWSKIVPDAKTGCWNWSGSFTSNKGVGDSGVLPKLTLRGKEVGARRLSYLLAYGELPKSVGCTCQNRSCVNPAHLTPAPPGRSPVGKAYKSKGAEDWVRTDERLVREVLTLRRLKLSQAAIAEKVGIGQPAVSKILQMAKLCRQNKLKAYGGKRRRAVAKKYGAATTTGA
jgi:hypothetical protein